MELAGIELEAFGGREVIFEKHDWESAAEILSEVEGPCRFGGAGRDRTGGLIVANDALSQLSYSPTRMSRFYHQASGFRLQASGVRLQASGIRCQIVHTAEFRSKLNLGDCS